MKLIVFIWMLITPAACIAADSWDQAEACKDLGNSQREVALSVLQSQQPYDCCDKTILECLSVKPVCSLVTRLANDICRRAAKGESKAHIEVEFSRRVASATAPMVNIDISGSTPAGDPQAKVEIVVYICARCPFCSIFSRDLYKSITSGRLKGLAKLYIRPFVLLNHSGSTAGAMAMLAAQEMGKFWDMFLYMCENFDNFDPAILSDWAALNGMDAKRFQQLMEDDSIREKLVKSQKEGLRNRVDRTPELFVNRRKYAGETTMEVLEDFVEGEHEMLP